MSTLPTILLTVAGAALIFIALRDVFDVLFHESGRAALSTAITRTVWRAFRALAERRRPQVFVLAGPVALLAVVALWALLLILGWALVYWPHMPDSFNLGSGVDPSARFVDSLYLSMVTLGTVGFGDIAPASAALRLLTPVEALLGFALVTASISWLLSIYPVLSRRRALAYEINLLANSLERAGQPLLSLEPDAVDRILAELTSRLVTVERDMATLPVTYYFVASDERFSLPASMPALLDLAEEGVREDAPAEVRVRALMLRAAVEDFVRHARVFHGRDGESTADLVGHYARDHLR